MPHSTPATAAADPDLVLGDTLDDSVARREAFPLWARERGPGYAPKAPASELISQEALRALVAAAEPDDVAGALSVLPCAQLTRVVGAAVASLPDDDAARVLGGAALSLDDDAAGELSRFLASTWISENLLGLAEQLVTFLSQRTLGGAVSDTLLHDSLTRLRRLETRVKAEKYRRIREVDARGSHVTAGARTPVDLLTRGGLTRGEANEEYHTATALADLPKTSEAFANGDIGAGQAAEAGKALHACARPDASAEEARKERDALDEQVANTPCEVDRRRLREQLEQRAAQRSKDRLADKERRAHRKRHGRKFRDGDLLTVQFGGPGAAVQKIWEMVSALACRSDTTDERTQQQRNFDATVHLADRYLAEGALPEVNLQRPHVLLITSHDALHDLDGADPATLDGYGPVSINTARMICCDAELTVVVMSADGQPLRVGRTRYQPSRAQRRAVTARDRVCVGCGADATRCEVHHITFWEGGGPTNIENLVLVCWNCHTHIHHHGWVVTRDADGRYHTGPPTADQPAQDTAHPPHPHDNAQLWDTTTSPPNPQAEPQHRPRRQRR